MQIEYLHASKYGNGATVAAEFQQQMADKGVAVDVHHIRDVSPTELAAADLYLFSSPGRFGKPIGGMRRFLKKVTLPAGARYAILTTEAAPKPDKKTGRMPTEEELAKWQRVRPIMNEILQGKGLVNVAEDKIHVTRLKGPLEDGWQKKVEGLVARIPAGFGSQYSEGASVVEAGRCPRKTDSGDVPARRIRDGLRLLGVPARRWCRGSRFAARGRGGAVADRRRAGGDREGAVEHVIEIRTRPVEALDRSRCSYKDESVETTRRSAGLARCGRWPLVGQVPSKQLSVAGPEVGVVQWHWPRTSSGWIG